MFEKGIENRELHNVLIGLYNTCWDAVHPPVLWILSKQTSQFSGSPEELQLHLGSQKEISMTC